MHIPSSGWLRRAAILVPAGTAAALGIWYFATGSTYVPQGVLRIGFENVPPVQIRTANGPAGMAVETVSEAAKRAGLRLQWIETGTSSEEALRRRLVDLWPLMVDLPDRRKILHLTEPWLYTSHVVLLRSDTLSPDKRFSGRIAVFKIPIHLRLVREAFPKAVAVAVPESRQVVKEVCKGTVSAGFLESRAALNDLSEKPLECAEVALRVHDLPDLVRPLGIGSTFEAAGAADQLRREIGWMFRDGTLAAILAKYSYGLEDTWATFHLMAAAEQARWIAWGVFLMSIVLAVIVWQAASLRQRRRGEAGLRESEERLKSAERLAHVGNWHRDLKSGQVTWSEECSRIFGLRLGYAPSEEEFFQLIAPQDREAVAQGARHCLEKEGKSSVEFRIVRPDGELRTVMSVSEVLLDEDGQPGLVFGAFQDITDVKRAQEETVARQKLESLGTLASGIAHDFNNLLGGMMAHAELALEEYHAGTSPEEELKRIRDGAIRGSEIVRQLMIYAGKESEAAGLVDVSQVARGMVELLKVSVSKHAALVTDFGADLPAVRGSAGQIQQIVMNLVTNASEALEDRDGFIRVTTRRVNLDRAEAISKGIAEGEYVQLEVTDTGRGMSSETQARVFDPFFTTKSQGHGLGLGVVRGIVRGLGGAVYLLSELGKGTTFQIFLRSTGIIPGTSGPPPSAGESSPPPAATILVVEDDDALRVALTQILCRRGFETLDVGNGADAINLLRAQSIKIDMMLLDMTIPGPSSREVAAVAAEARPEMKLVLTSAYDEKLVRSTVGAAQACGFVRKPFQIEELVHTLGSPFSVCVKNGLTGTSKDSRWASLNKYGG